MVTWLVMLALVLLLVGTLALRDVLQSAHAIRRIYPLVGRLRYFTEEVGPELRQYIVTSDLEERPFHRAQRAWVYRSAKGIPGNVGFGTQYDLDSPGAYHFLPSIFPVLEEEAPVDPFPHVLGPDRPRPFYSRARVNIAPMSFGALSAPAVEALASGACDAGIAVNTGEGGLSDYHLAGGCDLIFQIGPAKYGVRTPAGELDWERLAAIGRMAQVVAIEIKLGQGAKPGKGGILPGAKVTPEIARVRGIAPGMPSHSPNRFPEFHDVPTLVAFVERVRETVPVPVGVKVALGDTRAIEELACERARSGRGPDYVSVDGAEGGTGAAPPSLSDHMALPMLDAVIAVDDAYRRAGARDRISIIAAGRVVDGAGAARALAAGADMVNVGRAFLLALGCIQSMRCHTNECPTGVATQSRWRQRGLVPARKRDRVAGYARALQEDLMVVTRSVGLRSPGELDRSHLEVVVAAGRRQRLSEISPAPQAEVDLLVRRAAG